MLMSKNLNKTAHDRSVAHFFAKQHFFRPQALPLPPKFLYRHERIGLINLPANKNQALFNAPLPATPIVCEKGGQQSFSLGCRRLLYCEYS